MSGIEAPLDLDPVTIVVIAGIGAAALILTAGFFLLHHRRAASLCKTPAAQAAQSEQAPGPVLDPFVFGSATERRTHFRRKGNTIAVLISDARGRAEPQSGLVVNRSTTGLGIEVKDPIAVGTVLSIRPTSADSAFPWVQVTVSHCQVLPEGCLIGCRFEKGLPSGVTWMFG
jgi:hypothetical protein